MASLVTDTGLADAAAVFAARNLYLGFGTGSGQTDSAMDLAVPVQAREAGIGSVVTTTVTGDTARVTGTVVATTPLVITEAGLFSAITGPDLEVYGDFAAITLNPGDSIAFTINVKFA